MASSRAYLWGVDPGPEKSAFVQLQSLDRDAPKVIDAGYGKNRAVADRLRVLDRDVHLIVIEDCEARGAPFGQATRATAVWVGAMWASTGFEALLLTPNRIRSALCGISGVGRPNLRVRLLDLFGGEERAIGGKRCQRCKGKGWFGRGRPTCKQGGEEEEQEGGMLERIEQAPGFVSPEVAEVLRVGEGAKKAKPREAQPSIVGLPGDLERQS